MNAQHITRRTWIGGAAAAASALAAKKNKFTQPVGVELYTVRNTVYKDPEQVLTQIAGIGYKEVEAGREYLDKIAPICNYHGIKIPAVHLEIPLIIGKWAPNQSKTELAEAIDSAKAHGVTYLVFPYLPPAERGDADSYKKFADKMNEAARQAKAAGVKFAYHNHACEFDGQPGQRPIDILLERFDKALVGFEVDVFWVSTGGEDPVAFLKSLKGRVPLIHLKDRGAGCPVVHQEAQVKPECFKEVGSGTLDFPAILRTAADIGVEHYFVEQDQTPGDPLESLAKSYKYLRSVSL